MARNSKANPFGQPTLEDLMVRFLASHSDAAHAAVETGEGEVEPHEVAAGFRVDPRAAWTDATTNITAAPVQLPPEWAGLVNQPTTAFAVPMAAGNFPQRVPRPATAPDQIQPGQTSPIYRADADARAVRSAKLDCEKRFESAHLSGRAGPANRRLRRRRATTPDRCRK